MSDNGFCLHDSRLGEGALEDWYASIPGRHLLRAEQDLVAGLSSGLFGYHLLQLGSFGADLRYLDDCRVRTKHVLVVGPAKPGVDLMAEPSALPIASDSVDVVLLPHTLDFSVDPQAVLREVERVLIPEGRLIVVGFNPLSLWGLWHLVLRRRGRLPWCGHFMSYPRVVDWLSLLGFDVERTDVCGFLPPLGNARMYRRLQRVETIGRRLWPMFAGVYALRAVKRVARLRPIPQHWRRPRMIGARAIEPTTREVKSD